MPLAVGDSVRSLARGSSDERGERGRTHANGDTLTREPTLVRPMRRAKLRTALKRRGTGR